MQHSLVLADAVLARGLTGGSSYTAFQYDLVLYGFVAAGLGLLASAVHALLTRSEVGKRYRASSDASAVLCGVAALGYLALVLSWLSGFDLRGESWVPSPGRYFSEGLRYADWTITVPLLTVELLAVCSVAGAAARDLRARTVAAAALMIVTGFVGNGLHDGAEPDRAALLVLGAVSTVPYVYLYVLLARAVRATLPHVSDRAGTSLRNALVLLVSVWGAYPVVYLVYAFADRSAGWAVTTALVLCAADLAAKVGFGALVHKVALLRTAEDANRGEDRLPDVYPQEVWVSHERLSEPHPRSV